MAVKHLKPTSAGRRFQTVSDFAEITADRISVLAEQAINVAAIDENAVEHACRRAEEALAQKQGLSAEETEKLESVVRFAYAQLDLKRRRRG